MYDSTRMFLRANLCAVSEIQSPQKRFSTTMRIMLMAENRLRHSTSTIAHSVSFPTCNVIEQTLIDHVLAALKDLHIIERTPDPVDVLDSDDMVLGQLNREQLESIARRFRV